MRLSQFRPIYRKEEPLANRLTDEFVEATGQFFVVEMAIEESVSPLSVAAPFALSSDIDFYDACINVENIYKYILPKLFTQEVVDFCSFCSLFPEARVRPNNEALTYGFRMDTDIIACFLICELPEMGHPAILKLYAFDKKKLNSFLSVTARGVSLHIPCANDGIVFYHGDSVLFGDSSVKFYLLPREEDLQIIIINSHANEIFRGSIEACENFFNERKHLRYKSFQIELPVCAPLWSASIEKASLVMRDILNRHAYVKDIDVDNFVERISHCFREACSSTTKVDEVLSFILPSTDTCPVFQEISVPQRWLPAIKEYLALSDDANGILPVVENKLSIGKFQNISSAASRLFAYPTIKQCHGKTHRDAESAVDEMLATVQQMLEHPKLNTTSK